MNSQQFQKLNLPDSPGAYFFLGARNPIRTHGRKRPTSNVAGRILYIGRATSLRDRVRSYFGSDLADTRGPKIVKMIEEAKSIDYRKTDSVLEAVLLEADMIKKFKPIYNTAEKDDKSFNCVVITDEDFPRVLVVRSRDLKDNFLTLHATRCKLQDIFGPFPEGNKLRIVLKMVRKIFPYHDKCVPCLAHSMFAGCKPCFNRQIGLCPGVCTGEITKQDYAKTMKNIRRLFEGGKFSIIRSLTADMKRYARQQKFEKAAEAKRQLFALEHIADVALITPRDKHTEKLEYLRMFPGGEGVGAGSTQQTYALIRANKPIRIEAFDVAHTSGNETVGVMTVVQGDVADRSAYRQFKIRTAKSGDDVGALREVLERRFNHPEWGMPDLVVLDGGKAQLNAAQKTLARLGMRARVVSVVKDEHHRVHHILGSEEYKYLYEQGILLANSEAHRFAISFHRRRRDRL